jgi:hypothetical protein
VEVLNKPGLLDSAVALKTFNGDRCFRLLSRDLKARKVTLKEEKSIMLQGKFGNGKNRTQMLCLQ